mgnify:FL=1
MIVGYVGNSGNCYTNGHKINEAERKAGKGAHLHLSLYKMKEKNGELLYDKKNDNFKTRDWNLVNPFNHSEGRIYK